MGKSRRRFSTEFKEKVVLEALKEQNTLEELGKKYELLPSQISAWKSEAIENLGRVFGKKEQVSEEKSGLIDPTPLYAKIGELSLSVEFLKKKLKL